MRFRIDFKIFLLLALFLLTKQVYTYSSIMLFAIIHELGHLTMGLFLGMEPNKLEIIPIGARISFKINIEDYNKKIRKGNKLEVKKIIIALAGPIMNIAIIAIGMNINVNVFYKMIIIYSNILLIIFNLLPIYPLDGGRIVKGILHIFLGKRKAEKYTNIISFIIVTIVTIIASITIFYLKNISIFIIILFLWGIVIKEDIIYRRRAKIYELLRKKD